MEGCKRVIVPSRVAMGLLNHVLIRFSAQSMDCGSGLIGSLKARVTDDEGRG